MTLYYQGIYNHNYRTRTQEINHNADPRNQSIPDLVQHVRILHDFPQKQTFVYYNVICDVYVLVEGLCKFSPGTLVFLSIAPLTYTAESGVD